MAIIRNTAGQVLPVFAYDKTTGLGKTGDAANITAYLSKDGGAAAALSDTNPAEMDATNMPGFYLFTLTQAETDAEIMALAPKSSTSNILVDQVTIVTQAAAIPTVAAVADAVWDEQRTEHTSAGSYGAYSEYITAPTAGAIANTVWSTNALDGYDEDSAGQALFDAAAGVLDAAGVRAAVGLAAANLDAQLGDIPTNAELATALGAADDATLAAIAALNNLSQVQAQTAATAALNAYDPPTKAEMDAGLASADDAVLAAIAALNNLSSVGAQAAAAAALAAYGAATGAQVPSAATVADAVWDEALAGHAGAGSTGEALSDAAVGGTVEIDAGDVWAYPTRTLTAATVAGPGAELDGANLTLHRGDTFSVSLTGLGNIENRTALWLTAKSRTSDADSAALFQVTEDDGLTVIMGAAAQVAANGSLVVTNEATGAATLTLAAEETAKLPRLKDAAWDVQMAVDDVITTLAVGELEVTADVTRATE
jgi:hypothetical protein